MVTISFGLWNNGVRHGFQVFFLEDGFQWLSQWKNGELVDHGIMEDIKDGSNRPATYKEYRHFLEDSDDDQPGSEDPTSD